MRPSAYAGCGATRPTSTPACSPSPIARTAQASIRDAVCKRALLRRLRAVSARLAEWGYVKTLEQTAIPSGQLALSGPAEKLDVGHWPVRGDLAHIRLAGRCFVPHYAVPMPRTVATAGATLRKLGRPDAEAVDDLAGGTLFNVLDIAGGWAWGQAGDDGFVGYLPLESLEERRG
ncbi:MAG: hypothetical protein KGM49_04455 [Sphingomonadales bacterium]|nr:hypothetical protein [Sphingomonadales bacterium]